MPGSEPTSAPDRTEVLATLWRRTQWLNEQIDNQRLKPTPIQRHRVYMTQVMCNCCRVILAGLKSEELELRILELEEKFKGAVIVPVEQNRKS